ncbi:hypothetical protein ILUMI_02011, partial [Ignelater luminosus]
KEIEQAKRQLSTEVKLFKREVQHLKTLLMNTSLNLGEIEAESDIFKVQQEVLFVVHQKVTDLIFQQSEDEEYEAGKENANNYKRETAQIELMRLPKQELPKYSGDVRGCLAFWIAFQEVGADKDIPSAEKYQYLVQSTVPESEAWKVVMSYPISGKYYDKAVEDLKERFGREKMLIKVYVRDLLKLVMRMLRTRVTQVSRYKLYLVNIGGLYRCNFDVFGIQKTADVINSPPSAPWIEECDRQDIKLTDLNKGSSGIEVLIGADVVVISMYIMDEEIKSMWALEAIELQEVRAMNKKTAKSIRKDIRQYNRKHIQQTIEQNKSLKVLRRKLDNGRKESIKLKNKKDETTSDRKEILTTAEEFYRKLYQSQQGIQYRPRETGKKEN